MTDGLFWIEVDGSELFRYSNVFHSHILREYPSSVASPYEDYQVARYWEDLVQLARTVMDPVPEDIAARTNKGEEWRKWLGEAWEQYQTSDDPEHDEIYESATAWWYERQWYAGRLKYPPNLWLWRVEDTIHMRWDNRDKVAEEIPVWHSDRGEAALPVAAFVRAVHEFHDAFIDAMAKRVQQVLRGDLRADIMVDTAGLVRDQWINAERLPAVELPIYKGRDWEATRSALATVTEWLSDDAGGDDARPVTPPIAGDFSEASRYNRCGGSTQLDTSGAVTAERMRQFARKKHGFAPEWGTNQMPLTEEDWVLLDAAFAPDPGPMK